MDHLEKLRKIESLIKEKIIEAGFKLEQMSIVLDQDENDILLLKVQILPSTLETDDEKKTTLAFMEIIENMQSGE